MVNLITQGKEEPVVQLQQSITEIVGKIVMSQQLLLNGIDFWGRDLLADSKSSNQESLNNAKIFFESIQVYDKPGKLKNFKYTDKEVNKFANINDLLNRITAIQQFATRHHAIISWLSTAETILPESHEWINEMQTVKQDVLNKISETKSDVQILSNEISSKLNKLKEKFITIYTDLHKKVRLGVSDDKRKSKLINSHKIQTLKMLTSIDLIPSQQLIDFQAKLGDLRTCFGLIESDLEKSPVCPHCTFKPTAEGTEFNASVILDQLDDELDKMIANWTDNILINLEDPVTQANLDLLNSDAKEEIDAFINSRILPKQLTSEFVTAIKDALSGLIKVPISIDSLKDALKVSSGSATPEEIKKRFETYIDNLSKGKDPAKIRLVME